MLCDAYGLWPIICWNHVPAGTLASYPGLLAPAFVACSTNAGEGLVKLSHVVWRTWKCGGVAQRVRYRLQTQTVEWLSARHQAVLATFLGFTKPLYSWKQHGCVWFGYKNPSVGSLHKWSWKTSSHLTGPSPFPRPSTPPVFDRLQVWEWG